MNCQTLDNLDLGYWDISPMVVRVHCEEEAISFPLTAYGKRKTDLGYRVLNPRIAQVTPSGNVSLGPVAGVTMILVWPLDEPCDIKYIQVEVVCEDALACGACETSCQTGCELVCETGCEVTCETGCETVCETRCEVTCETGCEVSCQYGCETACQAGCEVSCETGCESDCETGCEASCETGCQTSCETGCEQSCETGCEVECETGCETACQSGCEAECESGCETSCEEGCEAFCQQSCEIVCESGCETSCESSCEAVCEQACQIGCETACETGCETECQAGCELLCESACEGSCQHGCEAGCETACESACQSGCETACETICEVEGCESGCEAACESICETVCEVSCETGCETACETLCEAEGCESGCQAVCESACQTGCEVSCQTGCETACETLCEAEGCESGCQAACEAACMSGCEVSCEAGCETVCETLCEAEGCESGCQAACESACQTGCETSSEVPGECGDFYVISYISWYSEEKFQVTDLDEDDPAIEEIQRYIMPASEAASWTAGTTLYGDWRQHVWKQGPHSFSAALGLATGNAPRRIAGRWDLQPADHSVHSMGEFRWYWDGSAIRKKWAAYFHWSTPYTWPQLLERSSGYELRLPHNGDLYMKLTGSAPTGAFVYQGVYDPETHEQHHGVDLCLLEFLTHDGYAKRSYVFWESDTHYFHKGSAWPAVYEAGGPGLSLNTSGNPPFWTMQWGENVWGSSWTIGEKEGSGTALYQWQPAAKYVDWSSTQYASSVVFWLRGVDSALDDTVLLFKQGGYQEIDCSDQSSYWYWERAGIQWAPEPGCFEGEKTTHCGQTPWSGLFEWIW